MWNFPPIWAFSIDPSKPRGRNCEIVHQNGRGWTTRAHWQTFVALADWVWKFNTFAKNSGTSINLRLILNLTHHNNSIVYQHVAICARHNKAISRKVSQLFLACRISHRRRRWSPPTRWQRSDAVNTPRRPSQIPEKYLFISCLTWLIYTGPSFACLDPGFINTNVYAKTELMSSVIDLIKREIQLKVTDSISFGAISNLVTTE